jgi:threonylcarbamoyladenosine tRNA methylthiotransferase MtaB
LITERVVRTASIVTLGCKLNQAESYRIQAELASAGVAIVPFGEPADLSIVNTCTVTHVADQQARQTLRRARRASPAGCVVAIGCYARVATEEVRRVEGVDLVVTGAKEAVVSELESAGLVLAPPDDDTGPDFRLALPPTRVRQFVKVQDGCDDYCTYCIVPFARGHSLSRPADEIVDEVRDLVGRGCGEVVLTGVQIGAYGRDRYASRGEDLPPPGQPLSMLVRRLLDETAIGRIRISSIQPQDWSPAFLELFENPRLCRHLHLPLQAGCDATLRRMARRYTTADFARLVGRVRQAIPEIAVTADLMVGFPGETEAHHADGASFVRAMGFADAHVFRYSPRGGTAAARLKDQVSPEAKKARSEEIRSVVAEGARRFRQGFIGSTRDVLWEEEIGLSTGVAKGSVRRWSGLTDNYLRVDISSADDRLGRIEPVLLASLDGDRFEGRVLDSAAGVA